MSAGARTRVWGLTGGIASGKSTVARLLEQAGIPVLDADQVSRELSAPGGQAHDLIVRRFGTADRGRLRELVFNDPAARRDLEAILHPLIKAESDARIAKLGKPVVIYEATLLVETGRYKDFEGLIVVTADRETRKRRLMDRNGFASELSDRILESQLSDEERCKAATHVVPNSGTLDELKTRVRELLPKLKKT